MKKNNPRIIERKKKGYEWWLGSKDVSKWAIKKGDSWWLMDSGEASPSYVNQDPDLKPCKFKAENGPKNRSYIYYALLTISALLGISLAVNVFYFFLSSYGS